MAFSEFAISSSKNSNKPDLSIHSLYPPHLGYLLNWQTPHIVRQLFIHTKGQCKLSSMVEGTSQCRYYGDYWILRNYPSSRLLAHSIKLASVCSCADQQIGLKLTWAGFYAVNSLCFSVFLCIYACVIILASLPNFSWICFPSLYSISTSFPLRWAHCWVPVWHCSTWTVYKMSLPFFASTSG